MTLRGGLSLVSALLVTTLIAAGCGGSSHHPGSSQAPATVLMRRAPNSLDPAVGDNPDALAADWLAYTPLLTFNHAGGSPGTQLVPGLAQTLPTISNGGTVYSFTLIKGLRYSDGEPVRASDFVRAAERAIRLWPPAAQLITGHIVGAAAFAARHASTIAGIDADDASGQITIRLTAAFGAIEDVLALPVLAPVPAGTPLRDEQSAPPPGVGPYRIADVVLGSSFSLLRTSGWQKQGVQTVPAGHLDIDVRITGHEVANARSVLDGSADVFDSAEEIPPGLLGQIRRRASSRYAPRTINATSVIFLNSTRKPFSSQLAREAVLAGLDQLAGLDSRLFVDGCYVLPPTVFGHPQSPCPYRDGSGHGNLELARALLKRSGMVGARVTVPSPAASPTHALIASYTSLLDQIGFSATITRAASSSDQQTGYATLAPELPNPVYFYDQLTAGRAGAVGDDPYVNTTVQALAAVPGSTVNGVSGFWSQLDRYVARKAYVAVLGYPTVPEFVSSRIDFGAVVFSPFAGIDWSSLRVK